MTQLFIEFVMQQAQNAALFLGQIPDPRRGQVEVNLPLAKMFIDQLTVIRDRTRGNLNPDEKKVIESAVSELHMVFGEVATAMRAQNLSAEIPQLLIPLDATELPSKAEEPAAPAPVAAAPEPPAPAAPVAAPEPPAAKPAEPEESRKRFTKSYGS
jgi:hypothetical protein